MLCIYAAYRSWDIEARFGRCPHTSVTKRVLMMTSLVVGIIVPMASSLSDAVSLVVCSAVQWEDPSVELEWVCMLLVRATPVGSCRLKVVSRAQEVARKYFSETYLLIEVPDCAQACAELRDPAWQKRPNLWLTESTDAPSGLSSVVSIPGPFVTCFACECEPATSHHPERWRSIQIIGEHSQCPKNPTPNM